MARPLRIEFAGALYHLTSRGDRREAIYEDDEDQQRFLDTLAEVAEHYNWVCHAYCLMTNYYHRVAETFEGNLSQGMRHLNGVYTQTSNRRHGRVGHLFQGRFKGILVDRDAYLLELARYVVLNPVRAGMVDTPATAFRSVVGLDLEELETVAFLWRLVVPPRVEAVDDEIAGLCRAAEGFDASSSIGGAGSR